MSYFDLNNGSVAWLYILGFFVIAIFGIPPIWICLKLYMFAMTAAKNSLLALEDDFHFLSSSGEEPRTVQVKIYAYYGFLASLTTVTYDVRLPYAEAEIFLTRINRYNFKWCWLAPAGLFVPFSSLGNLWVQRRSIRRQIQQNKECAVD